MPFLNNPGNKYHVNNILVTDFLVYIVLNCTAPVHFATKNCKINISNPPFQKPFTKVYPLKHTEGGYDKYARM